MSEPRSHNYFYAPTGDGSATSSEPHVRDVTERLTQATLQLCETQAQMDELIEANLRLRRELGEATLALFLLAPHSSP